MTAVPPRWRRSDPVEAAGEQYRPPVEEPSRSRTDGQMVLEYRGPAILWPQSSRATATFNGI